MSKQQFRIEFSGVATIELDDAVINAVDDEWRKTFYSGLNTPLRIAEHIAYNLLAHQSRLSQLDGWADQPDGNARLGTPDWDIEAYTI